MKSFVAAVVMAVLPVFASAQSVVLVQSTTSTQNSGLYDYLLPLAEAATGLEIRVVAVGTGRALDNARRCDGDILITHAPEAEAAFVEGGYGTVRIPLMYNDFVIVGPTGDPAGIADADNATAALTAIMEAGAFFFSRGDDSGTHMREGLLWDPAIDRLAASGGWYRETGSGMGATLNIAAASGGYTLTDRATWLTFQNPRDLAILFEGDPQLFNQYAAVPVSPRNCPNANHEGALALAEWLSGEAGQTAIGSYTLEGVALFTPNAN